MGAAGNAGAQPVKVLTIGGSDSGGAAGIQADLKTWTTLGVYGMSAVTVVTAQNSAVVEALYALPPEMITAQIEAVLTDYGAEAVKTGFLGSAAIVAAAGGALRLWRRAQGAPLVVDPVLVNHRGQAMFGDDVAQAYRSSLLPACTLATPNRREAELLWGRPLRRWQDVVGAALALRSMGAACVLITAVRRNQRFGDAYCEAQDVLFLEGDYLQTNNTHGSGDTLSAAAAAYLALGYAPLEATQRARAFTASAIRGAMTWRMGAGHGPLDQLRRRDPGDTPD